MEEPTKYPRLLRRVQALLIDSLIFFLIIFSWWMAFPLLEEQPTWIRLIYPACAWLIIDPVLVSFTGGTPGHHLRHIMVLKHSGNAKLGILQSLIRSLLKAVTGWWSFIFVLMTKRHQALHDLLAGSVVVIKQPERLPGFEQLEARFQDSDNYHYPSPAHKLSIILLYLTIETLAYIAVQAFLLSDSCLISQSCSPADSLISLLLSLLWLIGVTASLVLGWRGYLPGARRRPKD
ncbi:MAG: RDD family protein [Candidatus Thiodiazotropha lotti]|nr:RDD family protein [Candidatus Thiodiazotropha lotti]MCG7923743.1 RDD family protein [Candidatus Thiodiazotropha lotti]MCG7930767.1 RDD family protein [Candidatus Thiodiazotropha lotti]MCG7987220.1 RDD family protein [Candidatus Thiodiazotropha lotti]MCG8005636.1 RDD family protein [Candidatus Thiodiazotropha lotti]